MMRYPVHLLKLIDAFKKLPGVGAKSAERFAFEILTWPDDDIRQIAQTLLATPDHIHDCAQCGCLIGDEGCPFCERARIHNHTLCVVAMPRDVFAIECTREFQGLYHVLGALLSPIEGVGPDQINFSKLGQRIHSHSIKEVIIALDSTLEGDATALYLKQQLAQFNVNVSRLAFGLPMGSSLDYVDGGTLARAFVARGHF